MQDSVQHLRRLASEKTAHARHLVQTGATPAQPSTHRHTATSKLRWVVALLHTLHCLIGMPGPQGNMKPLESSCNHPIAKGLEQVPVMSGEPGACHTRQTYSLT